MGSPRIGSAHTELRVRPAYAALVVGLGAAWSLMTMAPVEARGCDHPAAGPASLSCKTIPERKNWRKQIVHVKGSFVTPDGVTVEGDEAEVGNANGLLRKGGGVTTLTTSGEHSTTLIVDLGVLAMGYLELGIESAEGAPIRASHASFRQFLGPEGDGYGAPSDRKPSDDEGPIRPGVPFGTDVHPWSRVDIFDPPSEPTRLESPGKRETRYLAITLDGPGKVEIDYVRIRQTIYPVRYDGYFLSSDELLNRAWYNSAYAQDLATVSEESSLLGAPEGPSPWMVFVPWDRVLFYGDMVFQALSGYNQSSDFRRLIRNSLSVYPCIQKPDGSFPTAASHLVNCKPGDPGPADGWRSPQEGPDPDLAVGFAGPLSIVNDVTIDQFTPAWLTGLADYHLYSGDAEFVRPLLPVARRVVGFYRGRRTEDGLYREPEDQRLDPDAEVPHRANWDPLAIATGVDAYTNAAWYDAIRGLALLEEDVAGRPEEAQRLRAEAEDLREALIAHLWDAEVGAMILNDEDPLRDHTSDANVTQLMFGTLDRDRAAAVMRFLDTTLATPFGTRNSEYENNPYRPSAEGGEAPMHAFMTSIEQLGRMRYGDGEGAVELIRKQWSNMLENGPGTGWYILNLDGSPAARSALTSWTTAVPALSEGVLGVRPTAAGFSRWVVAPQPSGLRWAQGRVPTPGGGISVRWRRLGTSGFMLMVRAPKESKGNVVVPLLGKQRTIAMDGEIVWRNGRPAGQVTAERARGAVVFRGLRGEHTLAWSEDQKAEPDPRVSRGPE